MSFGNRVAALGVGTLFAACAVTSCGNSATPEQKNAGRNILRTTTTAAVSTTSSTPTTTTTTSTTTTTAVGVAVPDVIGMTVAPARAALRAAKLPAVYLNTPCTEGTKVSQSVVSSLSIPGKAPEPSVGAVALSPGTVITPGTQVGITWSGCFGGASEVPAVVGQTFAVARHALRAAGLTWACYSVSPTSTKATTKAPHTVLTQDPAALTVLHPGATVTLTMQRCPQ